MSKTVRGSWLPLTPARKMVLEILHHGRKVPALPLSKSMHVGELMAARQSGAFISWTAIFLKAYALVAQQFPELRRAYMPMPWPHLYEHPISECALLLERELAGENMILGAKLRAPEHQSLAALDESLHRFRTAPLHEIGYFRQWLRVSRLPGLLRRFLFWQTLNWSGFMRAKRFGTFVISSLGSLGVEQHHPISPLTTYLTFGPIVYPGQVNVTIIYDHRVMDGRCVARCLLELERTLNTQILAELRALRPGQEVSHEVLDQPPGVQEWIDTASIDQTSRNDPASSVRDL